MILCFRLSTDISSIACFDKAVVDKDLLIWSKPLVLIDAFGLVSGCIFSWAFFKKISICGSRIRFCIDMFNRSVCLGWVCHTGIITIVVHFSLLILLGTLPIR